jgi:hypothetical protein
MSSRRTEIFQPPQQGFYRVLQCTCPVAASWKYFSAIHTSPHLTSTHLTPDYINNIILHLLLVLFNAVNVRNKINVSYVLRTVFTIWHKFRPLGVSESVT